MAEVKSTQLEVSAKVTLSWFPDNEECKFVSRVLDWSEFLIVTFLEKFENCTLEFKKLKCIKVVLYIWIYKAIQINCKN